MPKRWVFGLEPKVPGHILDDSGNLPLLDPQGRFHEVMKIRHHCRLAAIQAGASYAIRQSLFGRSRPYRGDYALGDVVFYWRAGPAVHPAQGHWMGPARVIGLNRLRRSSVLARTSSHRHQMCTRTGSASHFG